MSEIGKVTSVRLSESDLDEFEELGTPGSETRSPFWPQFLLFLLICGGLAGFLVDRHFENKSQVLQEASAGVGRFGADLISAEKAYAQSGDQAPLLKYINGAKGFQNCEAAVREADPVIARDIGRIWSEVRRQALVPRVDLEQFRLAKKKAEEAQRHFVNQTLYCEKYRFFSRLVGFLLIGFGLIYALTVFRRLMPHQEILASVFGQYQDSTWTPSKAGMASSTLLGTESELLPICLVQFESDGRVVHWSQALSRLTGIQQKDATNKNVLDLFGWSAHGEIGKSAFYRLFAGEPIENVDWEFIHFSGEKLSLSATLIPTVDQAGNVCGGSAIVSDNTLMNSQRDKLVQAETEKNAILRAMGDTLIQVDHMGRLIAMHDNAGLFSRAGTRGVGTTTWQSVAPPEVAARLNDAIKQSLLRPETPEFEFEGDWEGERRCLLFRANSYGRSETLISIKDISARSQIEEAKRQGEVKFRELIEGSADLIMLLDRTGIIKYASLAVRTMLGYSDSDVVGRNWLEFVEQDDRRRLLERASSWLSGTTSTGRIAVRHVKHDGTRLETEVLSRNLLGKEPVDAIVLNIRDVSERRALEIELAAKLSEVEMTKRALTDASRLDPVTGLLNFQEFSSYTESSQFFVKDGGQMVLVRADINGFRRINLEYGRTVADLVLKKVGQALRDEFGHPCVIARLSGGEFCVLVPESDVESVLKRCQNIQFGCISDTQNEPSISMSFGAAQGTDGESAMDWFGRAMTEGEFHHGRMPEAS